MLFHNFNGRKKALQNINRYMGKYPIVPMFYRTNVFLHSERVAHLVKSVSNIASYIFEAEFNPELAYLIAKTHDDTEIGNGDITLIEKQKFSAKDWRKYHEGEVKALEKQSESWPKYVAGYQYIHLIFRYIHMDTPIEKVVALCDKLDGLNECKHEVFAGNKKFIKPVKNYEFVLNEMSRDDDIAKILNTTHPLFELERDYSLDYLSSNARPHTLKSVMRQTRDPSYNFWKILSLYKFNPCTILDKKE